MISSVMDNFIDDNFINFMLKSLLITQYLMRCASSVLESQLASGVHRQKSCLHRAIPPRQYDRQFRSHSRSELI